MKLFNELLSEMSDSPYRWRWTDKSKYQGYYTFLRAVSILKGKRRLEIEYTAHDPNKKLFEVAYSVDDETEITGGGDAFKILSTWIDNMKAFIRLVDPNTIIFTSTNDYGADDVSVSSRTRVYERLIKRHFSKSFTIEHDKSQGVSEFIMRKK